MSFGQFLIVSGTNITVDYSSGGIMKGVNIFDPQDKLRDSEFLRKGISIQDVIQAIHEPVLQCISARGLKGKSETWFCHRRKHPWSAAHGQSFCNGIFAGVLQAYHG
jgi:hypothetical protein